MAHIWPWRQMKMAIRGWSSSMCQQVGKSVVNFQFLPCPRGFYVNLAGRETADVWLSHLMLLTMLPMCGYGMWPRKYSGGQHGAPREASHAKRLWHHRLYIIPHLMVARYLHFSICRKATRHRGFLLLFMSMVVQKASLARSLTL